MRRCITTLAIGTPFLDRWNKICRRNWENYARAIDAELVIVSQALDTSARAASRSPAWQKLLLPDASALKSFDQVAWIDSDILFNVNNPVSVFDGVPRELVGAVDSFGDPTPRDNAIALHRFYASDINQAVRTPAPDSRQLPTADKVYLEYGLPVEPVGRAINAGVLVYDPRVHAALFRFVYDNYDDRGSPSFYENVPLSYELVNHGLVHWMDPKFNHLWAWEKVLNYPFLNAGAKRTSRDKVMRRVALLLGNDYEHRVARRCATTALLNCHCLHFAGCANEMDLVDLDASGRAVVRNLGIS